MDAAREAAKERFRPILMTSLAFICGVSPLLIAGGAGAQSRHSLGTGVFFGMLIATSVGIFFIPLFFTVIRRLSERRRRPTGAATHEASASWSWRCSWRACAGNPGVHRAALRSRRRPHVVATRASSDSDAVRFARARGAAAGAARAGRGVRAPAPPPPSPGSMCCTTRRWCRWCASALRDNQDIREAIGRVNEYRAMTGTARSYLFPELDANASASKNQIVIGASPAVAYNAVRATADLQWELDFWGRIRKGIAAAEADQAARADDERALVLTLVGQICRRLSRAARGARSARRVAARARVAAGDAWPRPAAVCAGRHLRARCPPVRGGRGGRRVQRGAIHPRRIATRARHLAAHRPRAGAAWRTAARSTARSARSPCPIRFRRRCSCAARMCRAPSAGLPRSRRASVRCAPRSCRAS